LDIVGLNKTIKEQEENLQKLQNEKEKYLTEIETYRKETIQLNLSLKEKDECVQSSSGQNDTYLKIIKTLEGKLDEYDTKITSITNERNLIQKERDSLQISFTELSSQPPKIEYVERERLLSRVVEADFNSNQIRSSYQKRMEHFKGVFGKFREDWKELYQSRESLIGDLKNMMVQCDHYRQVILDLEAKIDLHNKSVGGNEGNLKQSIEVLTRTSLSKKSIDMRSNLDNLMRASVEIEALKSKLMRLEMNKFTGSQALGSITKDLEEIVSSEETVSVKESKIITSDSFLDKGIK
jgi:chromosome segregation ATPase